MSLYESADVYDAECPYWDLFKQCKNSNSNSRKLRVYQRVPIPQELNEQSTELHGIQDYH